MLKEDPGAPKKCVIARVKATIPSEDTAAHTTSLPVQGMMVREFEGQGTLNWTAAISTLLEWCFKFALNSVTDTLPHNSNLCRRKKLSSPQCQLCRGY